MAGQEPQYALEEAWLMSCFTEAVALRAATGAVAELFGASRFVWQAEAAVVVPTPFSHEKAPLICKVRLFEELAEKTVFGDIVPALWVE